MIYILVLLFAIYCTRIVTILQLFRNVRRSILTNRNFYFITIITILFIIVAAIVKHAIFAGGNFVTLRFGVIAFKQIGVVVCIDLLCGAF